MLDQLKHMYAGNRKVEIARTGDERLGPLKMLPGKWLNAQQGVTTGFERRGWNMIALPFEADGVTRGFRMLVNQYNEVLEFMQIDGPVKNRGLNGPDPADPDQGIFALDYQQAISQISAGDFPATSDAIHGSVGDAIHHEPGFFLNLGNLFTDDLVVSRLATIPHGDSVLAMGKVETFEGVPAVEAIDGLPVGAPGGGYLAAYDAFSGADAFKGVEGPDFPGFDVREPHKLLELGLNGLDVKRGVKLVFDTQFQSGGIHNIPFVTAQANATDMRSTFYIMELNETDMSGQPKLALAYAQVVMLDFFKRVDGVDGLIRWPHVSINTMVKVSEPKLPMLDMPYPGPQVS